MQHSGVTTQEAGGHAKFWKGFSETSNGGATSNKKQIFFFECTRKLLAEDAILSLTLLSENPRYASGLTNGRR
jgi:hypothetical protein